MLFEWTKTESAFPSYIPDRTGRSTDKTHNELIDYHGEVGFPDPDELHYEIMRVLYAVTGGGFGVGEYTNSTIERRPVDRCASTVRVLLRSLYFSPHSVLEISL